MKDSLVEQIEKMPWQVQPSQRRAQSTWGRKENTVNDSRPLAVARIQDKQQEGDTTITSTM